MALWLVRSIPERAVQVRALAGDIVLCSWARHFTLTVPLSTQVYKWVLVNLMLGVTLRWTSTPSRGLSRNTQVPSCYRNRDKLQPDGPQLARTQTLPTCLVPFSLLRMPSPVFAMQKLNLEPSRMLLLI